MKKSNKKSNKIAFFVIHDAILSLTLKGKSLSIKIMEVNVQSILFQHPCNIFITGPSGCGKTEFVHKLTDYRKDLFNIVPEKSGVVLQRMATVLQSYAGKNQFTI